LNGMGRMQYNSTSEKKGGCLVIKRVGGTHLEEGEMPGLIGKRERQKCRGR